ncbi:MAG: XTP/dITP diphosphatase [Deltaproteobacteria bacterium]|nr:XTP/dITP diphosphatase [Deltaproteobacteria bacterium]MBI2992134.1 XTP/dITP diphosphatase [Deltaproteobacteria bacterium]MBI3061331.1 XTP/dITP diphosphatase [Deltaproteobacteria bacterium]
MRLLVATTNAGKFAEIEAALKGLPVQILPLSALKDYPEVVEDGESFEENARKKARALAEFSGYLTLADDSGLEVDALDGAPGVHSARYSGEDGDDARNNEKLLRALQDLPWERRGARFVCVMALRRPASGVPLEWIFHGVCEGSIAFEPRGTSGFGYDPLFFYPPLGKTFGEVDREIKGRYSHRGKALAKLKQALPFVLRNLPHP